ncbi:MAG: hypothetical protein HY293_17690 [Planctomycetes bacterium]|nr:hypothetical protein [Planctomycetota bacterium]
MSRRLLRALLLAMGLSSIGGVLTFVPWALRAGRSWWTWTALKSGLPWPIGYMAASFWVLFAILYFTYVRQSAATREYQERLRRDEEQWRRSKRPRI